MKELKDFVELVDRADRWTERSGLPKPPSPEEVTRTVQVLLAHQAIYPHQNRFKRVYEILTHHRPFFEAWFAVMGAELFFEHRSRFFVLRPIKGQTRQDAQSARLPKDVSMVLAALKVAYEDGMRRSELGEWGEVRISSDDLVEKLDIVAGTYPEERRLSEILTFLKRKGIVELDDFDRVERVRPIAILPAIDLLVTEEYLQQIIQTFGGNEAAAAESLDAEETEDA